MLRDKKFDNMDNIKRVGVVTEIVDNTDKGCILGDYKINKENRTIEIVEGSHVMLTVEKVGVKSNANMLVIPVNGGMFIHLDKGEVVIESEDGFKSVNSKGVTENLFNKDLIDVEWYTKDAIMGMLLHIVGHRKNIEDKGVLRNVMNNLGYEISVDLRNKTENWGRSIRCNYLFEELGLGEFDYERGKLKIIA